MANHSGSTAAPASGYAAADRDKDNDTAAVHDDTSNAAAFDMGHAASATDTREVTQLVKRYYKAALASDGAAACSMLNQTLAEAVPEDYGEHAPGGPSYMRGARTCDAALTLLFRHLHGQLTVEIPHLQITRVRLIERHGVAFLRFGPTLPEREISVGRQERHWILNGLIDSELP